MWNVYVKVWTGSQICVQVLKTAKISVYTTERIFSKTLVVSYLFLYKFFSINIFLYIDKAKKFSFFSFKRKFIIFVSIAHIIHKL